jgi:hypothetical protein
VVLLLLKLWVVQVVEVDYFLVQAVLEEVLVLLQQVQVEELEVVQGILQCPMPLVGAVLEAMEVVQVMWDLMEQVLKK